MKNDFINITKTSNLKNLDKSQVDKETFENHISIKNTQNTSRNYSRKFSFWKSIQRYHKKRNTKPKCWKVINVWFASCVHFKAVRWCLLPYLTVWTNYSLRENTFPEELIYEVIPWYKKLHPLKKESCTPVSLLPHVSKVFERIIYQQIIT